MIQDDHHDFSRAGKKKTLNHIAVDGGTSERIKQRCSSICIFVRGSFMMNHGVLRWELSLTIYDFNVYIFIYTYHILFPHLIENTLVCLFSDFSSDVVYFL